MIKICNYGCGQESKYQLKNGKFCCSEKRNSCPMVRKNLSNLLIGRRKLKLVKLQENTTIICSYGCNKLANYFSSNGKYCCEDHYKKCPAERNRCKLRVSGSGNPMYGTKHTEDHKKKIGLKILGKTHNQTTKDKIRKKIIISRSRKFWGSMTGKHHSSESREKISIKNKGKKVTKEFRESCSVRCKGCGNPMYGKHHSTDTKLILSKKHKENFLDENFLKKWTKSIQKKKNKPETIIDNILKELNKKYIYVGDYKVWIGGKNPDFLNEDNKKIIEFFGDYWHDKIVTKKENFIHDKERVEHFQKYGYKTLIIRQKDLEDLNMCIQKILEFDDA